MGGLNLIGGTTLYIVNLLKLRRRIGMTRVGFLLTISLALVHITLWFSAVLLYLGYTLDEEDERKEVKDSNVKVYVVENANSKSDVD